MTLHPLLLALMVADVLAVAAILIAAVTAARVATGWAPGAPTRAQLALERRVEAASLQGRAAFWLLVAGTALLAVAVASALPTRVPGAMCGTGVMDAMGGLGERALILRGLAVAALGAWHLVDRLDRRAPSGPLAPGAARALLVATPLALLAAWDTLRAVSTLDVETAVSCCAAVYEVAGGAADAFKEGEGSRWLPFTIGAALLVIGGAAVAASRRLARGRITPWALAAVVLAWAPIAALFLVEELAAYHYEVLGHHCPWCLFLGDHGGVGYVVFAALALVALEGPAGGLAATIARRARDDRHLEEAAVARARRAGFTVALATLVFVAVAAWPAVSWRLTHGLWIR